MEPSEERIDAAAKDARKGCFCENNRKPCTYHEGYEDGLDVGAGLVAAGVADLEAERDALLAMNGASARSAGRVIELEAESDRIRFERDKYRDEAHLLTAERDRADAEVVRLRAALAAILDTANEATREASLSDAAAFDAACDAARVLLAGETTE